MSLWRNDVSSVVNYGMNVSRVVQMFVLDDRVNVVFVAIATENASFEDIVVNETMDTRFGVTFTMIKK